jgi:uncharacterized protein YndB with AHSA1/START domain
MAAKKNKFQREYIVKSSPKILYNFLSSPSGLSEWFADDVNVKNDVYTFQWNGSEDQALLLEKKQGESIKFQWADDENTDAYFEFKLKTDPLTEELALIVTDFAEKDEMEESSMLWDSQIQELLHKLGS